MSDLEIRSFKNSIVDYINKHEQFPVELKRLVLSEIVSELTATADKNIRSEIQDSINQKSDPENSPE